jgi:hypothetical protein
MSSSDKEVTNMSDGSSLVVCTINIVNWLGDEEFLSSQFNRTTVSWSIKLSVALVSSNLVSSAMPLKWCNINFIWSKFHFVTRTESMPISVRRAICFGVPHMLLGTS